MKLFTDIFSYILLASNKYNIDESHAVGHSMNVLHFAYNIYNSEVYKNKYLEDQEKIIYVSAAIHDMCDKKYVNETEGIKSINNALKLHLTPHEIDITKNIITTMSYSKVKANGMPDHGNFQLAYNIVREADLLAAYDFDRCMLYHLYKSNSNIDEAYNDAVKLFNTRIFKHSEDKLLTTKYAQLHSILLTNNAMKRMLVWRNLLKKF